ncbi:glycoside hydrolase family 76 protein [Sphingobacterium sp. HJSM2_6]|uniref:glycoside hydrolase family 76 protein n=1 Tax=Sphingobacterium sp. HJSM2_6 TaxID=3366264 RepID=UPI003BC5E140
MMKKNLLLLYVFILSIPLGFSQVTFNAKDFQEKAKATLDSVYKYYSVKNSSLLRENYPFDQGYQASYLGTNEPQNAGNAYSYLWPFSGSLSAQVALYEIDQSASVLKAINNQVLPGLAQYYDKRSPHGYASYINTAKQSDRFYDDNVWLGIDFADLYLETGKKQYLKKAEEIWKFVESGMDDKLGGGIYWCEQRKESKNTCSNAPGVVYLVKLYQGTKNKRYLDLAKSLYDWTKKNLQDPTDFIYFDNIQLTGKIGKAKYPYNSGQMLQAAVLLYTETKEARYLKEAKEIGEAGHQFFFNTAETHGASSFKLLKNSDIWFIAIMMRGYASLFEIDQNPIYINSFKANLTYAWNHMRDKNGLFIKDWTTQKKPNKKWLLDQLAFVEMYARLAHY